MASRFRIKPGREYSVPRGYDQLAMFTEAMLYELQVNAHKETWEPGKRTDLKTIKLGVSDITYHAAKLIYSIMTNNKTRVLEHAADVANCALIVADQVGVLNNAVIKARREEPPDKTWLESPIQAVDTETHVSEVEGTIFRPLNRRTPDDHGY